MKTNFKHSSKLRVRYGETDQMGYCYYGNYAQYLEVGRVEALRSLGMSYKSLETLGIMLPVSSLTVNYKLPAKYDDLLCIKTTIVELRGPRLLFEYTIEIDGKEIATATTTLVFVGKKDMRPIQAPSDFTALLKKHEIISSSLPD